LTSNRAANIVAIEASAERCSVALAHGGAVHGSSADMAHRHSEGLPLMVRQLLGEHDIDLTDIDAFAFAAGPGGFTGLRVACAFTQGLAFGCDRPVVAINSLRALAHAAGATPGVRLLSAIDARMGQVYWCVFEGGSGGPRSMAAPALADPTDLAGLVERWRPDVIAGDALTAYESCWPHDGVATRLPWVRAEAPAVAQLACLDWASGLACNARDAVPEYVRDQVALTVAQRHAASRAAGR
jgi:tRNA threonylcarbamoyladenosine biosynthesis protein TsaB